VIDMTTSSAVAADRAPDRVRRIPVQRRSRERVEQMLAAAERLLVSGGVEALTTRGVAAEAKVPVASVYQYFADREAIIEALIERHVVAMDEQLAGALAALATISVRTLVEATVAAYVAGYRKRPGYVIVWFQGRVSPEIATFVRRRSAELAERFHAFAVAAGLVRPDTDPRVFALAAEMIDAFLAVAYRDDLDGDQATVREGIEMIVRYVEPYATARGRRGIAMAQAAARLDIGTT
jgi:AcrR family transcriptional regulator